MTYQKTKDSRQNTENRLQTRNRSRIICRPLTASEQEIIDAMKLTWQRMKIVIEASCAVPLATILKNRETFTGKRVGVIITGGNVDLDTLPWIK